MHFTPAFLAAYARVQDVARTAGEEAARVAFRDEMLALGHKERIRNLYRVRDKRTSKVRFFVPNEAQREYLEALPQRGLILKTRQLGFTTVEGIREVDYVLFEPDFHAGIMAHKQEAVKKLFEKCVKFVYKHFVRDWGHLYNPTLKNDNTTTLFFEDDGLGRILNSSVSVAFEFRSGTLNKLHVSEAAFVDNERLAASMQTVPDNGEITYESTPNGRGGDFFEQWQHWKAQGTLAPFRGFFFPWFKHYPEDRSDPRWQLPKGTQLTEEELELKRVYGVDDVALAWRRWKIMADCQNDTEIFNKEYPTDDESCFFSGEAQVFPPSITQAQAKFNRPPLKTGFLYADTPATIKFVTESGSLLTIWEEPQPLHSYVIGADPSQGVGKDRAAAYVLDQQTGRYVARLWGHLAPEDFANELQKLGRLYHKAYICVERNNHGHVVLYRLRQLQYVNLYRQRALDQITGEEREDYGFLTTNDSKLIITEHFRSAARTGELQILDRDLISEMTTFVQVGSKNSTRIRREALPGCHDDLVIAAALAWEMNQARPVSSYADEPLVATPDGYDVSYDPDTGFPDYQ